MGGVWFDLLHPGAAPIVWCAPFPAAVQQELITAEHPHGTISISDLELVGTIAHKDVLASTRHVHEHTLWVAGDNKALLSWATKGSATSDRARAYLLRLNALHQRAHCYVVRHHFIAGTDNSMADDASRLWHLNDSELLTHFNSTYPQSTSWELRQLGAHMLSALNGALFKKRCVPACLLNAIGPVKPPGGSGRPFVPISASLPTFATPLGTRYLYLNSLPTFTEPVRLHPAASPSHLARWEKPYEAWDRRFPGCGPSTLT